MIRWRRTLSPEARALLDRERSIPPLPGHVRARAMARARAALIAGNATAGASSSCPAPSRWAAGVMLACVASAAVGAAAYEIRARMRTTPGPISAARPVEVVAPAPAPSIPAAPSAPTSSTMRPTLAPASATPRRSPADAVRDELRLLRRARAAVAREDFSAALSPIAQHTRRFRDGRLVEEREALRVKALTGLGRTQEAQRAADAFVARFPHSVLLPAVSQMPVSRP